MCEAIKQHGLGYLIPTAEVLSELQEKFLSVFDVASILESRSLPWYIIHHDVADLGASREPRGPIPGNDYHASDPRITTDPSAWDSKLRLEPENEESGSQDLQPLVIPLKHISQHSPSDSDGTSKIEEAARLIRKLWPDDSVGPPRRRLLGRQLTDASAPEYHIFHWLASKKGNREGISVTSLFPSSNGNFVCSNRDSAVTAIGESTVEETKASTRPINPSEIRPSGEPFSSAQIWSFICRGVESPISFPIITAILCLLSKPNKQSLALKTQEPDSAALSADKFADKDISWCLDSLHGFSRRQTPCYSEAGKGLSFALGTSSDCWMHFHFVFHFYEFDPDVPQGQNGARGSGLQVERNSFSLPVEFGRDQYNITFGERRIWLGMRVATNYCGEAPNASPSAVGVILSDWSHWRLNATTKTWESERGIESPPEAPGVALFQMTLWTQLDRWETHWNRCLDSVDSVFKIKLETQADVDQLDRTIGDAASRGLKTCTRLIMLLLNFRYHFETVVKSVQEMYVEWERTYPGEHTERYERFTIETQKTLLANWKKVLSHLDKVNSRLDSRVQSSISELREIREGL